MNTRTGKKNRWSGKPFTPLSIVGLLLVVCVGCSPAPTQQSEQLSASPTKQVALTTALPTAPEEVRIPAGWVTQTSHQCEYAISFPSEMQLTKEGSFSETIRFNLANPDEGARNFVYVSVIIPENQSMDSENVYNYDSAEAEILRSMQIGERKALREVPDASPWTYQRMSDTPISEHTAQTYENDKPWEFPEGTKEIRYYLSLDGCTYLIGGYLDTTQSDQPGAITEDLFHQIVSTIRVMP
jgi:hypothetical protein